MAEGGGGCDPPLTIDLVREFILSKGGKIHNSELVAQFRGFLNDRVRKSENRQKIKEFVNTLVLITVDPAGEKILTLKKKYRAGGNFEGVSSLGGPKEKEVAAPSKTDSKTKKEKKDGTALAASRNVKESSKMSQSCDDFTVKNVAFEDKEENALATKAEQRSKSVEDLDSVKMLDPFLSPEVMQEFEMSQENLVSPVEEGPSVEAKMEDETEVMELDQEEEEDAPAGKKMDDLSVDQPDAGRKQSPGSQNGRTTPRTEPVSEEPASGGLRVKDLARNLNQMESDSQSQTRPLTPKNKREPRKSAQNDDDSADYGFTFTELDRDWLLAASKCEYLTMLTMMQGNPELARKRDFITGYAPLHWAAKSGKEDVVKLLHRNNADVNVRTRGGYTPLHLAAMQNHYAVAELLVKVYGADTNIRDYSGRKAKQCMGHTVSAHMSSLLQSGRRNSTIPESPSSAPINSMIGKALFAGAIGGLRLVAPGKENAPIPRPAAQEDNRLMPPPPPPHDLPPVGQRAKPAARQKGTHSDSEMPSPISEPSLHSSDSSPSFGAVV